MSEPPRVAFKFGGFKKPVLSNVSTTPSAFETSTTSGTDRPELVTGFDNGEIRSNAPAVVKKEFVIPSQPNAHQFFKSKPAAPKKTTTVATPAIDQLEDEAKRALILDAQQANEAWNDRDQNGAVRVHTIEQDATNTFMAGSTADADGAPAEEEPEVDNADYEQVPIEEFGMAVLRGMGYKDDSGLGITNKQQVNVFVPESRPRGLGLGADRKVLEKINQLKRNLKKAGIDEKDDLCLEKGAFVLIEKGPHADLYGTIESIEEDVARLTVSLAIGGTNKKKEVISISQYSVKLVTEKEFLKYSKYVNKSKADRVEKETSDRLMKDYRDRDDKRPRSSRDNDDADYERRHHRSSNSDRHDRKQHRDRHDDSSRSRRH